MSTDSLLIFRLVGPHGKLWPQHSPQYQQKQNALGDLYRALQNPEQHRLAALKIEPATRAAKHTSAVGSARRDTENFHLKNYKSIFDKPRP
jgi:hypothetical protein